MPAAHPQLKAFNVRVYGIDINDSHEVLLAYERHFNKEIAKFPGGGLEFGEGTIDALKREWKEETEQEIEVLRHYYTTDFYQQSFFNPAHQIISIYYLVRPLALHTPPQVAPDEKDIRAFRRRPLDASFLEEISLPIDKHVANLLLNDFLAGRL